jgi:hypothetical protein
MRAEDLLQRQLVCPVCESAEREVRPIPFRSNRYIAAFARTAGMEERALFDTLTAYTCGKCGGLYFDPWFSLACQRRLYGQIYPQHNLGWYRFWSSVADPAGQTREAAVVAALRAHVGRLETYAELGCPFNGLLPYLGLREYARGGTRFWDHPGSWRGRHAAGMYPHVRGNVLNFERVGLWLAGLLDRVQLARAYPARRLVQRALVRSGRARRVGDHGVRCVYIRHQPTTLWGGACASLGVDCRQALDDVFGIGAVDLEDVATAGLRFDVIAVCNALDHYKQPARLVERLFAFTDHVYLEGHHGEGDFGKQHLFFFEPATIEQFASLVPGAEMVRDFRAPVPPNWYSLLLRRRGGRG